MIYIRPVAQETEYNCGPAVLQMLLGYAGRPLTQNQLIEAAQISRWIKDHGMQPHHMTQAISQLAPDHTLYFKNKATIEDLGYLIHERHMPVAINWQGLFYETPAEEPLYPSPDNGHYSIVVDIDVANDSLTIIDPYPSFSEKPRSFSLNWFTERWWDIAQFVDPHSQESKKILTNKLLFFVAANSEQVPKHLGFTTTY